MHHWIPEDTVLVVIRCCGDVASVHLSLLSRAFVEDVVRRVLPPVFSRFSRVTLHRFTLKVTRDLLESTLEMEDEMQRRHERFLAAQCRVAPETLPTHALVSSPLILFDACTLYERSFRQLYASFTGAAGDRRSALGALGACGACGAEGCAVETHTPPYVCRKSWRLRRRSVYPRVVAFCLRCLTPGASAESA